MNPAQERLKEIEEIDILKINTGSHSMIDEEDYQELKSKMLKGGKRDETPRR